MLIPVDMMESPNMYAIDLDSMRQVDPYRYSYILSRRGDLCIYSFDSFFFGKPYSHNGVRPLGVGTLNLLFDSDYSGQVDGIDTYRDMSVERVMDLADNLKDGRTLVKSVKPNIDALFGGGKVWSTAISDEEYRILVESFFNLPQLPPGTDGWFKRVKS